MPGPAAYMHEWLSSIGISSGWYRIKYFKSLFVTNFSRPSSTVSTSVAFSIRVSVPTPLYALLGVCCGLRGTQGARRIAKNAVQRLKRAHATQPCMPYVAAHGPCWLLRVRVAQPEALHRFLPPPCQTSSPPRPEQRTFIPRGYARRQTGLLG